MDQRRCGRCSAGVLDVWCRSRSAMLGCMLGYHWKRGILNRAAYGSRDRVAQKTLTDFALIYDVPQPLFKSQSHLPFAMISRAGNAPLRGEFSCFVGSPCSAFLERFCDLRDLPCHSYQRPPTARDLGRNIGTVTPHARRSPSSISPVSRLLGLRITHPLRYHSKPLKVRLSARSP